MNIYKEIPRGKHFVDANGVEAYIGCRMHAHQDSQYVEGIVMCIKEHSAKDYLFGVMSDDPMFQGHNISMLTGENRRRGWWVNTKNAYIIEEMPTISESDFDSFLE